MKMWNEGKLMEIWKEGSIIQKKMMLHNPTRTKQDISRIFSKLMFQGKVSAALKFLDKNSENAVLKPTEDVINKLKELHPEQADILPGTLIQGPIQPSSPAYFNNITEMEILRAASRTKGSGGPSLMDASQWKRILCSAQYKLEN